MTFSSCTDPPCVTCALQINPSLRSFTPVAPALFKVGMGKGYLELPQGTASCVEVAQKGLSCIIPSSNHTRHGYQHVTVATYLLSSVCPCPVEIPEGKMSPSLLDSSGVYVLDCGADIFVWYVWMYTCAYICRNISCLPTHLHLFPMEYLRMSLVQPLSLHCAIFVIQYTSASQYVHTTNIILCMQHTSHS